MNYVKVTVEIHRVDTYVVAVPDKFRVSAFEGNGELWDRIYALTSPKVSEGFALVASTNTDGTKHSISHLSLPERAELYCDKEATA